MFSRCCNVIFGACAFLPVCSVCISCLSPCQPACLPACLPARLSACLPACLLACPSVCLSAFLSVCLSMLSISACMLLLHVFQFSSRRFVCPACLVGLFKCSYCLLHTTVCTHPVCFFHFPCLRISRPTFAQGKPRKPAAPSKGKAAAKPRAKKTKK